MRLLLIDKYGNHPHVNWSCRCFRRNKTLRNDHCFPRNELEVLEIKPTSASKSYSHVQEDKRREMVKANFWPIANGTYRLGKWIYHKIQSFRQVWPLTPETSDLSLGKSAKKPDEPLTWDENYSRRKQRRKWTMKYGIWSIQGLWNKQ